MSPSLKSFLQRWAITTLSVLVAANIVGGIHYEGPGALIVASLLLGVLNAVLRPIMMLLTLPLLILSLGLFTLVINAFLLYLVGAVMKSFTVDTFGAAFWGGLVISLVSMAVHSILGIDSGKVKIRVQQSRSRGRDGGDDPGGGPVIDV